MPFGKKDKKWLRPISELKGGLLETEAIPVVPDTAPVVSGPEQPQVQVQQQPQMQAQTQVQPQPQPQVQPQPQQYYPELEGGQMDPLSIIISTLNTNPYFIGMLMLLLNLGGRFLSMELTQKQEEFLQQRWLRPLIFFTVIFVATRNLAVAFWMTLALFILLWILANEKSPFCIIPSWREETTAAALAEKEQNYEKNMNIIQSIHNANK
jgi:hypothetical protein